MFPHCYFPAPYFPGGYFPPAGASGSAYPDLLAAVVAYLRSEPTVVAVLGVGYGDGGYGAGVLGQVNVFAGEAPADCVPPYLVIDGYAEALPGESAEDSQVTGQFYVVTNDLSAARAVGRAVKNAMDAPNINPRAVGRKPFVWATGRETTCLRDDSRPERQRNWGRGGRYVWVEEIDYEFWVTPSQ